MAAITPPPSPSSEMIGFAIAHEVRNLLTPAKAYAEMGEVEAAAKAIDAVLEFAEAVLSARAEGECDLFDAVDHAIAGLGPQQRVLFHVELDRGTRIGMPAPLLERVLGNLLLNCVQAMGKRGGEVRIECFTWNGKHRIQVTDTGPGRKSGTIASRGRGLQICAFLLDQCGGTLDLEFKPEVGATATIDLPLIRPAAKAA
jgi:C4-dicarboxylate-specific signal transduction histidine kinase